jgi:UDP-N-acetylmuramoyl-L-alanyl-D-glutamate--2,6-diaminopimelate ligase
MVIFNKKVIALSVKDFIPEVSASPFPSECHQTSELLAILQNAAGLTCHSSEVQPGYLFIAIRGRKTDGHLYVTDAIKRGAKAIVTDSPHLLPPVNLPVVVVNDARQALSWLAAQFYRHPSSQFSVVGVTGSNGKTTITCMLDRIFDQAGYKSGLIGTVRVNVGNHSFPSVLTTPDAVNVQRYLMEMQKNGVTHAAMEVSAQGIEMHRVANVHFSCGILSNICPDHLDFHETFDSYLAAKCKFLPLLEPNTPLIVNVADSYCRDITAGWSGRLVTVSPNPLLEADITALPLFTSCRLSRFLLSINQPIETLCGTVLSAGTISVTIPLPGLHNIENALLAATAALLHGISPAVISSALIDYAGVERRLNIHQINGFTVVDDTALNPGSIAAIYQTLNSFGYRNLVTVNAIRGCRGPAINSANAATFAQWHSRPGSLLIVTDSADETSPSDKVTTSERQAFLSVLDQNNIPYYYRPTLADAVNLAAGAIEEGDLLALLGAQGMDNGLAILRKELDGTKTLSMH